MDLVRPGTRCREKDANLAALSIMMGRSVFGGVGVRAPGFSDKASEHGCGEGGCVSVNLVTSACNHH